MILIRAENQSLESLKLSGALGFLVRKGLRMFSSFANLFSEFVTV